MTDDGGKNDSESRKSKNAMQGNTLTFAPKPTVWAIYTQWSTAWSSPITKFETTWIVPPPPKIIGGQVFFIFNALVRALEKRVILQPVLMWGRNDYSPGTGDFWTIASWYVNANTEHFYSSPVVRVNTGDELVGRIAQYPIKDNRQTSYGAGCDFKGYPVTYLELANVPLFTDCVEVLEINNMDLCKNYPFAARTRMKQILLQSGERDLPLKWVVQNYETNCGQKAEIVTDGSKNGEIILNYCSPDPPNTSARQDRINTNQGITVGTSMYSENGRLRLTLQDDGNLVLYTRADFPLWNCGRAGSAGPWELIMQADGNLVEYDIYENPIWSTETNGTGGTHFQVNNDGNLAIYNDQDSIVWMSGSSVPNHPKTGPNQRDRLVNGEGLLVGDSIWSPNGVRLTMQPDGNLVLYSPPPGEQPIWNSGTAGRTNVWDAVLQDDGNFVVYDVDNKPLWAADKFRDGGCTLVCQDDGNLVNYSKIDGNVIWATASNLPFNKVPAKPIENDELLDGQGIMCNGQVLASSNGLIRLQLEKDGNLVLRGTGGQPMWASGTNGKQTWCFRVDNGFVTIYDVKGEEAWANGYTVSSSWLKLQDDGNVVLTDGARNIWQSDTTIRAPQINTPQNSNSLLPTNEGFLAGSSMFSPDGRFKLTLRADGNLFLYGPEPLEKILWTSGNGNRDDVWNVRFQPDGNFVIYNWRDGGPIWASDTTGRKNPPAILKLTNDGKLQMLDKSNQIIWQVP